MKTISKQSLKSNHSTFDMISSSTRVKWNDKRRYSFSTRIM